MSDDLYESVNPPEVESGVMKASEMGFHDDYLGSITYDFGGGGGYWDSCGFAFVPDILPDDHAQCNRPPCYYWRLATELLPENSGLTDQGNPVNYFDNCGIGEEYGKDGLFKDIQNGYYIGGGTGTADALKLKNELIPFDSISSWIAKSWEILNENNISMEQYTSLKGIQSIYSNYSEIPINELCNESIYAN